MNSLDDAPQRSQAWHDARKGKMTCSAMAEAVGLVGSRRALWRTLTGRAGEYAATERMQHGIDCEQIAVAMYEEVMRGHRVTPVGFVMHPTIDWIGGSPDGMVGGAQNEFAWGGLEVKCPQTHYHGVPPYYMPQVQGLMEITNKAWWDFVVWTEDEFTVVRVYRSPAYWQQLYTLLCEFWAFVECDVEPPKFARGTKPRIVAPVLTRALYPKKLGEQAWA